MRIGPEVPRHRRGHCMFDPTLTGRICGAPATEHLWLGPAPAGPDSFATYTCDDHRSQSRELGPTDWHEIGPDCLAAAPQWQFGDKQGESFCYEPGDDPSLMLAASEPIGATA